MPKGLECYLDAYSAISAGRQATMAGHQPIQMGEIRDYFEMVGGFNPQLLIRTVRLLDAHQLEWIRKLNATKNP